MQRLIEDRLKEFHSVLAPEGRKTSDHFVDDAAEAPPVDSFVMSLFFDDFWGEILGCSTD